MSFASCIIPELRGQKIYDELWYIRTLTKALNKWIKELDKIAEAPVQLVNGTGIIPGTSNVIKVKKVPAMKLTISPEADFLTEKKVKEAMWGINDLFATEQLFPELVEKSFIRLFMLVGKQVCTRWTGAVGNGIAFNGSTSKKLVFSYTHFAEYGTMFYKIVRDPFMNPELFHGLLGAYLSAAINATPKANSIVSGIWGKVYTFTGVVRAKLPLAE